jgi:hypothetical protein
MKRFLCQKLDYNIVRELLGGLRYCFENELNAILWRKIAVLVLADAGFVLYSIGYVIVFKFSVKIC